jgi:hypothetical protein
MFSYDNFTFFLSPTFLTSVVLLCLYTLSGNLQPRNRAVNYTLDVRILNSASTKYLIFIVRQVRIVGSNRLFYKAVMNPDI